MAQFGQSYIEPYELLSIGIGNVDNLYLEESQKFCKLVELKFCENNNLENLHSLMNLYLLSLKPDDFITNLNKLKHSTDVIFNALDASLKSQTLDLHNFQKTLEDIKIYVNNVQKPTKEQKEVIKDILNAL